MLQAAAALASSWQLKVEPVFELVNVKFAVVELVGLAGLAVKVTVGAVVSTVQVYDAVPVLPARSVAVTVTVCDADDRPLYVTPPLLQAAAAFASSLHWKVEPVFELVKVKFAVVELVGFAGLAVKVTTGAAVSTVHVYDFEPVTPFAVAEIVTVCEPSASVLYVKGLVHVVAAFVSSWQLNVEPLWSAENANVADVWLVGFAGPDEIVTTGGVATVTLHVYEVGSPVTPAWSMARTWKVCEVVERLEYVCGLTHAVNEGVLPPSRAHW